MEPQNVQDAAVTTGLVGDIRVLIGEARAGLAATVNSALTMLYWRIGRRIRAEVLQGERAGYGEQIVASLALQLEADRRLRRQVAIELKLGEFKAADKGQMELDLRWLAKHEQEPGEAPPLGIILCTGKNREQIELLELDQSGIHVAEYLTGLPSRQLLEQELHEAVALSKARLENRPGPNRLDPTASEVK